MEELIIDEKANSQNLVNPDHIQKHIFIKDLRPKDVVRSTFLVKSKETLNSKNGKPYLAIILADRTGEVDCRVWDNVEEFGESFQEGEVVGVSAKAQFFQNRLQLIIQHLATIPADEVKISEYLPSSVENLESLYQDLLQIFEALENPWVKKLSLALLTDPQIASRYKVCPAAKTIHHAFIGGLLCHSLQLIRLAKLVAPFYEGVDLEIALFGAAFHDFGKIFELSYDGNFSYTPEGQLVGHIAIGTMLIDRKIQQMPGFPKELEWQLKHLILSHHGRLEYGSPKKPATLEAQLVHHLDDMDSKLNSIQTLMKGENNASRWTAHHRAYDQHYYKPDCFVSSPESTS